MAACGMDERVERACHLPFNSYNAIVCSESPYSDYSDRYKIMEWGSNEPPTLKNGSH